MLLLTTHSLPASWEDSDFPVLLETIHAVRPGSQQGCHSNGISPQIRRRQSWLHVCAGQKVLCVCLQRGQYGVVCVFASTLCKYDLSKGDLFILSLAMVRRVCTGVFIL